MSAAERTQLFKDIEAQHNVLEEKYGDEDSISSYHSELDSEQRVLDECFDVNGNATLFQIINFNHDKFMKLFSVFNEKIAPYCQSGRGVQMAESLANLVFMILTTLKTGCRWYTVNCVFRMHPDTLKK